MRRRILQCTTTALAAVFVCGCAAVKPLASPEGLAGRVRPGGGSDAQAPPESTAEPTPRGYVIGADDVVSIVFWRDKDLSADVVVRPDGKISLPLLNDVQAAGFTPEQLREQVIKAASKFMEDPNATVVVKQINSRRVYITGNVSTPGTHPLTSGMTVLQLIAVAGGLLEYADTEKILIVRPDAGTTRYLTFNYDDVIRQKNLEQNIALMPGDTVVVP